jgi:predicted transport protein
MTLKFRVVKTFSMVIISASILLLSCEKSTVNQTNDPQLVIKAGFDCGWGAGDETIEITKTSISYVFTVPSKSQQPKINKKRSVSDSEWTEIQDDISMNDFVKLDYHTCNVCVDGCDEWIFIQNSGTSHKITFGKGLKINSISKLQAKLAELRLEFNP